jgi:serpin B
MKRKILFTILICGGCILLGGVLMIQKTKISKSTPKADDTGVTLEKINAVVKANNQFAFDLYSRYKDKYEGNIFFSPYSISVALAMTYEGARGQTAKEIQAVFHFPEAEDIRRPGFARIYNEINKKNKKYELHTANALWAQKDYLFLDTYFIVTEKYYGGKVRNVDFEKESEKSRQMINAWVKDQTRNRIKDLISKKPRIIDKLTTLVITNAIYFKGKWVLQFDRSRTREADFRVSPTKVVKVPMMSLSGEKAKFNYAETEDLQILEMPYEGEELSMLVLLPKEDNLAKLEQSLDLEKLNKWRDMLQERKVDVYMPKFKLEIKYFMEKALKEMGMPSAFIYHKADFSGMTGRRDLFISRVIHQAFVEVNEEGTEAAGATAVIIKKGVVMPTIFRADHPFIFIIQERKTGNIFFMGKVANPIHHGIIIYEE